MVTKEGEGSKMVKKFHVVYGCPHHTHSTTTITKGRKHSHHTHIVVYYVNKSRWALGTVNEILTHQNMQILI